MSLELWKKELIQKLLVERPRSRDFTPGPLTEEQQWIPRALRELFEGDRRYTARRQIPSMIPTLREQTFNHYWHTVRRRILEDNKKSKIMTQEEITYAHGLVQTHQDIALLIIRYPELFIHIALLKKNLFHLDSRLEAAVTHDWLSVYCGATKS